MKRDETEQKIKELEDRIKALEARPLYYPVVIPQYAPVSPPMPWPPIWCYRPPITYTSNGSTACCD